MAEVFPNPPTPDAEIRPPIPSRPGDSNAIAVLVTGGTGFAGGHLCARLVKEGYRVQALVRDPARAVALSQLGVVLIRGDLGEPSSLQAALEGVTVVYHLAAEFRRGDLSPKQMWAVNAQGTRNILEAAQQAGVQRFVHCSTVGVHGDTRDGPANEDAPYRPGDAYQRSKAEGERIALEYMSQGRLPVVIFRPGGIYGPGDRRFLKLFRAIQKGRFMMLGSGQIWYQLVYIDDLIDGVLLCGTRKEALGRIYILTGEKPVTLNQLIEAICRCLGVTVPRRHVPLAPVYAAAFLCELFCRSLKIDPPLHRRRIDFFRKSRWFDISRAKRELGFRPQMGLNKGLELTASWYRQQGYL